MEIKLTKEEIEAIIIDVKHVLDNCSLKDEHKNPRESLLLKLKPEPTREEITALWVKENNIVVGSKVKVVKKDTSGALSWVDSMDTTIGKEGQVFYVGRGTIGVNTGESWYYNIESLEPYKEEFVPFTWEDRDLFRDKWIKTKNGFNEHKINFIGKAGTVSCANWDEEEYLSSLFESHEFIDGTPFGKLK